MRKMEKYRVYFRQQNADVYEVEAGTEESAIKKATAIYKKEHDEPTVDGVEKGRD